MYCTHIFEETTLHCPECGEFVWIRYGSKRDCCICRNPHCLSVFPIGYEQLDFDSEAGSDGEML